MEDPGYLLASQFSQNRNFQESDRRRQLMLLTSDLYMQAHWYTCVHTHKVSTAVSH